VDLRYFLIGISYIKLHLTTSRNEKERKRKLQVEGLKRAKNYILHMEEQKGNYALSKFYDRKYEQQNSTVDTGLNREPIEFRRNHTENIRNGNYSKIRENRRKSKKIGR
jgi:uncharacterized protein (DUF2141 family)